MDIDFQREGCKLGALGFVVNSGQGYVREACIFLAARYHACVGEEGTTPLPPTIDAVYSLLVSL